MSVSGTEVHEPLAGSRLRRRPDRQDDAPPELRLVAAPVSEPPYDDELPQLRGRGLPVRLVPAPLRVVPEPEPWDDEDLEWTRPRTALAQLPSVRPTAHAFVQRLLEVLAGVRPLAQLQRDTTPDLYARLERYTARQQRLAGARPDARAVRSVHVQARPDGIAEVSSTVVRRGPRGPRVQAFALRLEGFEGRWCCTELLGL